MAESMLRWWIGEFAFSFLCRALPSFLPFSQHSYSDSAAQKRNYKPKGTFNHCAFAIWYDSYSCLTHSLLFDCCVSIVDGLVVVSSLRLSFCFSVVACFCLGCFSRLLFRFLDFPHSACAFVFTRYSWYTLNKSLNNYYQLLNEIQ